MTHEHEYEHVHYDELGNEIIEEHRHSLYKADRRELRSVGIDIGSTTSHLIFSRLVLRRQSAALSSRFEVAERQVDYASPIMITPFAGGTSIDTERLSAFFERGLRGVRRPSRGGGYRRGDHHGRRGAQGQRRGDCAPLFRTGGPLRVRERRSRPRSENGGLRFGRDHALAPWRGDAERAQHRRGRRHLEARGGERRPDRRGRRHQRRRPTDHSRRRRSGHQDRVGGRDLLPAPRTRTSLRDAGGGEQPCRARRRARGVAAGGRGRRAALPSRVRSS